MQFTISNLTFIAIPIMILLLFFAHKLSDNVARNKFNRRNENAVEVFDGYDSYKSTTKKESNYLFFAKLLRCLAAFLLFFCMLDCFNLL